MEALKAVALTPLSVLSKRTEPRKSYSLTPLSPFKNQSFPNFKNSNSGFSVSGALQGILLLLPSTSGSDLARALTYDEALQQSVTNSSNSIDFDIGGVFGSFATFVAENALIIGGGAAALVVPLVVAQLISKPKAWGVVSAKTAYAKLGDEADAQLVDIRTPAEIRQTGGPDIRGLKKKPITVGFNREDKSGFLSKLGLKFKDPENTTLFILDRFDGNSELVAELVTANGFKAAYAIRDGAEGSRGWLNSSLPWIFPKKAFSFDLSGLADTISDTFGVASDAVPLALGAAAAAVFGVLTYAEVEPILQLAGSVALFQLVSQNLLPAEGRKQTTKKVEEFLKNEIALQDLPGDIQKIGIAFLPFPVTGKALPVAVEATPDAQPEVEAALEPSPAVNSVPQAEAVVQEESPWGFSRPLSPYPNYPDYKPPSSPMPSQP